MVSISKCSYNFIDVYHNKIAKNSNTILIGDFNLPRITRQWNTSLGIYSPLSSGDCVERNFLDKMMSCGLDQSNFICNKNHRIFSIYILAC